MTNRRWAPEEIAYLESSVGHVRIAGMANRLNRTPTAVINKLKRLGLSNTVAHVDGITAHALSKIIGVDRTTLAGWIKRHGLPCRYKHTRTTKRYTLIDIESFWEWAKENKHLVDFSKIPYRELLPEPRWVNEERQKNWGVTKRQTYEPWTLLEIDRLIELREQENLTFGEIAKQLGRTETSVYRKYKRERPTTTD